MRRGTLRTPAFTLAAFGLAVALAGCGSSEDPNSIGNTPGATGPSTTDPNAPATPATPAEQVKQILDARQTDYGEALRSASLKLNDQLPTLDQINAVANAPDLAAKKVVYEAAVDTMIADPKFATSMVKFFKDTFRTGQVGTLQMGQASKDTAANFAAQVVVEGRSWAEIFTATTNTCPTFDATTGAFTPATCMAPPATVTGATANPPTVGILTDPGLLSQYYSNMAFRRARFVQETFACSKYPSEFSKAPVAMGNGTYTNPGDFNAITGFKNTPTARIDFQDTSAVVCANCHGTSNHFAPLFANYDAAGFLHDTAQVMVPVPKTPFVALTDYQPGAPVYYWRIGNNVTDIAGMGAAIAADPDVGACAVNRVWNLALSRGDIVNDLATIPPAITAQLATDFNANGKKLKETIRTVFKSEDFTKF